MCVSPHEMTAEQLQRHLDYYRESLAEETDDWYKSSIQGRIEQFEELLKEKADEGKMIDGS